MNIGVNEILLSIVIPFLLMAGIIILIVFIVRKSGIIKNENQNWAKEKKHSQQMDFLQRMVKKEEALPAKIALPQLQEIRYVEVSKIIRCEADNTYTNFFLLSDEKIMTSRPLKEYVDMLTPYGFIRSHQSHLINPSYIKSWLKEDGGILLLTDGYRVPVSKPNRERVKNLLNR